MESAPWHGYREGVFAVMRVIDAEVSDHFRRARALDAGPGRPMGGAAFDERVKGEALETMLRELRRGASPAAAAATALEESRIMVRGWNKHPGCVIVNHPSEAHRWEDTAAAMLADRVRRFAEFGDPAAAALPAEPPRTAEAHRLPHMRGCIR